MWASTWEKENSLFCLETWRLIINAGIWGRSFFLTYLTFVCVWYSEGAMSITVKQQWEEGERELEPSSNANPSSPPGSFQVWMPLQNYFQLKPMGQAFVLLHQTVTGCVIPWGRGQGSFLQLKAILRQGLSCKLPRVNIPEARRMNILALKCISSTAHQSVYCAWKKRGI